MYIDLEMARTKIMYRLAVSHNTSVGKITFRAGPYVQNVAFPHSSLTCNKRRYKFALNSGGVQMSYVDLSTPEHFMPLMFTYVELDWLLFYCEQVQVSFGLKLHSNIYY